MRQASSKVIYGWCMGLVFVAVPAVFAFSMIQGKRLVETRLSQAVELWEPELAASLAVGDWLVANKLAESLRMSPVDKVHVRLPGRGSMTSQETLQQPECSIAVSVPVQRYGAQLAELQACMSVGSMARAAMAQGATWVGLSIVILVLASAVALPLLQYRKGIVTSLSMLRQWSKTRGGEVPVYAGAEPFVREFFDLVRKGVDSERKAQKRAAHAARNDELAQLAAQVAHDVRSPLAALGVATHDLSELDEDKRVLIRMATQRINDIANVLIDKHRFGATAVESTSSSGSGLAVVPVHALLDELATEARLRHQATDVAIVFVAPAALHNLFVEVDAVEFRRVLSNLLNNAVEASHGQSQVTLNATGTPSSVLVQVRDHGPGVPAAVLARLGEAGNTRGKKGGSGLGLFHAKRCVEGWSGTLALRPAEGGGTEVEVALPRAQPPAWFVPELVIPAAGTVAVVDDDKTIHQVWAHRFGSLRRRDGPGLLHVRTAPEVGVLMTGGADPDLYLVDYELVGWPEDGLNLARHFPPHKTILVTSHAEDRHVQAKCGERGILLLPKRAASIVPIRVAPPSCRRLPRQSPD